MSYDYEVRLARQAMGYVGSAMILGIVLVASAVVLAGCSSGPAGPSATLKAPSAMLLKAPAHFPAVAPGDDPKVKLAEAASVHVKNARHIRGLQKYIAIIRREE